MTTDQIITTIAQAMKEEGNPIWRLVFEEDELGTEVSVEVLTSDEYGNDPVWMVQAMSGLAKTPVEAIRKLLF